MPLISFEFRTKIADNNYKGSPCLQLLSNLKESDKYPFCSTQYWEIVYNVFSNAFSIYDHDTESNAFSKSTNNNNPGMLCDSG